MAMPILKVRYWITHRKDLLMPAAIVVVIFLCGLVSGALVTHTLNFSQQEQLKQYLNNFLQGATYSVFRASELSNYRVWSGIFKTQVVTLCILWLSGMTLIGVPLIILLIAARGFVLGFTVGFLVYEKAEQGLLLALVGVLPQNLFYIPATLGAAILSFYFSLTLLHWSREYSVYSSIAVYSLVFILFVLVALAGSWVETYLIPGLIRLALLLF